MLFPDGKRKAFTLSYDDGITQDRRLVKLFHQYGVKGTFNLNPGLFGMSGTVSAGKKEVSHIRLDAEEVRTLYEGQEIAAHGQYHLCMAGMDTARCVNEILESRKGLESVFDRPITGFAYAFGAYDESVLLAAEASGISYARTTRSTGRFDVPENFLAWDPTCRHNDERLFDLAEEFLSGETYFSMRTPVKLFYVWGHSYEFEQDDNWERMEQFLGKVGGQADVWYATNGEIRDYVEAHRRLLYSVDGRFVYNPSAVSVWLAGSSCKEHVEVKPGGTAAMKIPDADREKYIVKL